MPPERQESSKNCRALAPKPGRTFRTVNKEMKGDETAKRTEEGIALTLGRGYFCGKNRLKYKRRRDQLVQRTNNPQDSRGKVELHSSGEDNMIAKRSR